MAGAVKTSPGGNTCCGTVACGTVSLPSTLNFTIAGIGPITLNGPGGTSGTWATAAGAIHAPGTEIDSVLTCTSLPYVEMFARFTLFLTANSLGQCFQLILSTRWSCCSPSCTPGFKSASGAGGGTCGTNQVNMTGVLNSFTWSPFSSAWTFATTWDGSPQYGTVLTGPSCGPPLAPLPLTPPVSGAATLTH